MTLKELTIGDIFVNAKDKSKKFIVRGNAVFNRGHGSSTRMCMDLKSKELISKSCRIEVLKLGESQFKEKYLATPINKI